MRADLRCLDTGNTALNRCPEYAQAVVRELSGDDDPIPLHQSTVVALGDPYEVNPDGRSVVHRQGQNGASDPLTRPSRRTYRV